MTGTLTCSGVTRFTHSQASTLGRKPWTYFETLAAQTPTHPFTFHRDSIQLVASRNRARSPGVKETWPLPGSAAFSLSVSLCLPLCLHFIATNHWAPMRTSQQMQGREQLVHSNDLPRALRLPAEPRRFLRAHSAASDLKISKSKPQVVKKEIF